MCALDTCCTCCTCCTRVCVRHVLRVLSRVSVAHLLSSVMRCSTRTSRPDCQLHPCFSHRQCFSHGQFVQLCKVCVSPSRSLSAKNCTCATPPAPTPAVSSNPRVLSTVFFSSSLSLFAAPGRLQNQLSKPIDNWSSPGQQCTLLTVSMYIADRLNVHC